MACQYFRDLPRVVCEYFRDLPIQLAVSGLEFFGLRGPDVDAVFKVGNFGLS